MPIQRLQTNVFSAGDFNTVHGHPWDDDDDDDDNDNDDDKEGASVEGRLSFDCYERNLRF